MHAFSGMPEKTSLTAWLSGDLQSVTANWQVHMRAGLRVCMALCANVGFGA
jgi:hypothetical protein